MKSALKWIFLVAVFVVTTFVTFGEAVRQAKPDGPSPLLIAALVGLAAAYLCYRFVNKPTDMFWRIYQMVLIGLGYVGYLYAIESTYGVLPIDGSYTILFMFLGIVLALLFSFFMTVITRSIIDQLAFHRANRER